MNMFSILYLMLNVQKKKGYSHVPTQKRTQKKINLQENNIMQNNKMNNINNTCVFKSLSIIDERARLLIITNNKNDQNCVVKTFNNLIFIY